MSAADAWWRLTHVDIAGFLGVGPSGLSVSFDRPFVILLGPNGSGKSTVLQAIEWALFGVTAVGPDAEPLKGTSLDTHRVYLHRACAEARVSLRFESGEHILTWARSRTRKAPKPGNDLVTAALDGTAIDDDVAQRLGLTADLYRRVMAPGQGALIALLSGDTGKRNAALDRLLGVERLTGLARGINRASQQLKSERDALEQELDDLLGAYREDIRRRFDKRREARADALEQGVERADLSLPGAMRIAGELLREVQLEDEAPQDSRGLHDLVPRLKARADEMWTETVPTEVDARLRRAVDIGVNRRARWQAAIAEADEAEDDLVTLRRDIGEEQVLEGALDRATQRIGELDAGISELDSRVAVLDRARDWLGEQATEAPPVVECPVCERDIALDELARLVDEALERLRGGEGALKGLREERATAVADRDATKTALKRLETARDSATTCRQDEFAQLKSLWRDLRGLLDETPGEPDALEAPVAVKLTEACQVLGTNEPVVTSPRLNDALNAGLSALADVAQAALEESRARLEHVRDRAEALKSRITAYAYLVDFLTLSGELDRLDEVLARDELVDAVSEVGSLDAERQVLHALTGVAEQLAVDEAARRVSAVAPALDTWFGRLSRHDAFRHAVLSVQTKRDAGGPKNSYSVRVRADDGWDAEVGPMVSGGYQTALGVALLCALNQPEAAGTELQLLALDEPTLSLDPAMTVQLGRALGQASALPLLIVTTTDEPFADAIVTSAGQSRVRVVRLADWKSADGTRLKEQT